jgi:hypothetical protein
VVTESSDKPDWLVDGAEVVVVYVNGLTQRANKDRVKKVSAHSFTIEGLPVRFRTRDQRSNYEHRRQVFSLDSAEGQRALTIQQRQNQMNKVGMSYLQWQQKPTDANRLALIEALQALTPKKEG